MIYGCALQFKAKLSITSICNIFIRVSCLWCGMRYIAHRYYRGKVNNSFVLHTLITDTIAVSFKIISKITIPVCGLFFLNYFYSGILWIAQQINNCTVCTYSHMLYFFVIFVKIKNPQVFDELRSILR